MLRRLVQNTAVSAVAFGIAGVLGLVAVGIVVRTWGYAALGLVVLVRNMLPTGFLALIDFGASETATQAVARARQSGTWAAASQVVSLLMTGTFVVGSVSALLLWHAAPALASLFKLTSDQTPGFVSMVRWTAVVLPAAFVLLVVEGVIKGYEEYAALRLVEIVGTVLYAGAVATLAAVGGPYEAVAYAFLLITMARAAALLTVARGLALRGSLHPAWWQAEARSDVLLRSRLMFNSRVAGILQHQLPPMAIGGLLGVGAVGVYDALTRFPRFLRSTFVMLNSAVLPVSARLDEAEDDARRLMLARGGFVLSPAIAFAPLAAMAVFAEDVLRIWVGPTLSQQWIWLSLGLLVTALGVMFATASNALISRPGYVQAMTRLLFVQIIVQYAATIAALPWLGERAFILGQVVAAVALAPLLAQRMLAEWKLPLSLFWSQVLRHGAIVVVLIVLAALLRPWLAMHGVVGIIAGMAGCVLVGWGLAVALALSRDDRRTVGRVIQMVLSRRG